MRSLNRNFSFVKLIPLAFAVMLAMFAGVASARIDGCQPDGMTDAKAEQFLVISAKQGKAFRADIDAIRASGVNYETDTTYDDLIADTERAIALAKERHLGRNRSFYYNTPENLRVRDTTLEWLFENRIQEWIMKKNENFFTTELTRHLQQLAVALDGKPTISPYKYTMNAKAFVFAFGQFLQSAELKYIGGSSSQKGSYEIVRYNISEEWALSGRKPNFEILIFFTSSLAGEEITLEYISFGGGDLLKNPWPLLENKNEGCLATFTQN